MPSGLVLLDELVHQHHLATAAEQVLATCLIHALGLLFKLVLYAFEQVEVVTALAQLDVQVAEGGRLETHLAHACQHTQVLAIETFVVLLLERS